MDWELVYISAFQCEDNPSGEKEATELFSSSVLEEDQEEMGDFLQELIKKLKAKKPSLSPSASCRAFQFHEDVLGSDDKKLCEQLLGAVSLPVFRNHAQLIATKYVRSAKARSGILFVINANTTTKKNMSPGLFVIKTDFQPGFLTTEGTVKQHSRVLLPELKKGMIYPHFDGMNFRFDQIQLFQKSSSDYFERLFRLTSLPDLEEIADESLAEHLETQKPGAYQKYFDMPVEDRRAKREVFGNTRLVQEPDLIEADDVSFISKKTQYSNVDKNAKPIRLKLQIDDGIRFEGKVDQLNQNYFFAQDGLEKFLIVRGSKFSTRSHFQTVEFMKLETLNDVITRIAADHPSNQEEDE